MDSFQPQWVCACRHHGIYGKPNHFKLIRSSESTPQPVFGLQAARDASFQSGHVEALAELLTLSPQSESPSFAAHARVLSLNYGALHPDTLPRCVPSLVSLFTRSAITEVELFHTGLTDASAIAIVTVLCMEECRITRLKLGENFIGDHGAQAFGAALRSNVSLRQLNLAGNQLTDAGVTHLADGLRTNGTLTSLCLRANPFGAAGTQALAATMKTPGCALAELQLKGVRVGVVGAVALASVLECDGNRQSQLATLELEEAQVGEHGAAALAVSLASNQSLTKLNLNGNQIGDLGAASLAMALVKNSTLTALGMRDNGVTGRGAEPLAIGLRNNVALTGLDVGDNQLGNAGAIALAKLLSDESRPSTPCGLQCVNLGGNGVESEGIRALAAALHGHNANLTHLDISSNGCSDADVTELAGMLRHNPSLTRLCLAGSRFGYAGYDSLLRAMSTNTTLRSLTLNGRGDHHPASDPSATRMLRQQLMERVEENKCLWKQQQTHREVVAPPAQAPVLAPVLAARPVPLPTPPVAPVAVPPRHVVAQDRGLNARAMPFRPPQQCQQIPAPIQPASSHAGVIGSGMFSNNIRMQNINLNINVHPTTATIAPQNMMWMRQLPNGGVMPMAFANAATNHFSHTHHNTNNNNVPFYTFIPAHVLPPVVPPTHISHIVPPKPLPQNVMMPQFGGSPMSPSYENDNANAVKSPIIHAHDLWSMGGEEFSGLGVCGSTASLDVQGVVDAVLDGALSGSFFCVEEERARRQRQSVNGGHAGL